MSSSEVAARTNTNLPSDDGFNSVKVDAGLLGGAERVKFDNGKWTIAGEPAPSKELLAVKALFAGQHWGEDMTQLRTLFSRRSGSRALISPSGWNS
jgi:hypothetical protein